jgi:hypothetical protein
MKKECRGRQERIRQRKAGKGRIYSGKGRLGKGGDDEAREGWER